MPRFDNSADSPQPCQYGCFAWTSTALQASSVRTLYCRSDTNASGSRNPYGLCHSLSTLHAGCSAACGRVAPRTGKCMRSTASAQRARLDTGGWLDLTRQGLSPCKIAPSFACRTNAPSRGIFCVLSAAKQNMSRCLGLLGLSFNFLTDLLIPGHQKIFIVNLILKLDVAFYQYLK